MVTERSVFSDKYDILTPLEIPFTIEEKVIVQLTPTLWEKLLVAKFGQQRHEDIVSSGLTRLKTLRHYRCITLDMKISVTWRKRSPLNESLKNLRFFSHPSTRSHTASCEISLSPPSLSKTNQVQSKQSQKRSQDLC